jgi:hypothetical protein
MQPREKLTQFANLEHFVHVVEKVGIGALKASAQCSVTRRLQLQQQLSHNTRYSKTRYQCAASVAVT